MLVQTLFHLPDFTQPLNAIREGEASAPAVVQSLKALFAAMHGASGKVLPPDGLRIALARCFMNDGRFQLRKMDDAVDCYQQIMSILVTDPGSGNSSATTAGGSAAAAPATAATAGVGFQHLTVEMLEQFSCSCGTTSEPTPSVQSVLYFPATALSSAKATFPRHSFGKLLREVFITESARGQ